MATVLQQITSHSPEASLQMCLTQHRYLHPDASRPSEGTCAEESPETLGRSCLYMRSKETQYRMCKIIIWFWIYKWDKSQALLRISSSYKMYILMMDLFLTHTHLLSSQDVNWWTGVVWIIVMFLWLLFWRHPFTAEHPLTLILTAPIHCRASIDSHSDGTHSLQSIHWLSFWRHPFTAEHPLTLILTAPIHCRASIDSHSDGTHSLQSIHWLSFWRHPFTAEHPLTLILTAPIHCWASIDYHSDGTHSLQSIHWLSFWRHPFTAEHPLTLILTAPIHCRASIDSHSDGTHSLQSIFWLSFWRHPFTAEHPLLRHWCNATFLQIWWRSKLITYSLRMSTFLANLNFWLIYSFQH